MSHTLFSCCAAGLCCLRDLLELARPPVQGGPPAHTRRQLSQGAGNWGLQQAAWDLLRYSITGLALPFSMLLTAPVTVARTNKGLSCCTVAARCVHPCRGWAVQVGIWATACRS